MVTAGYHMGEVRDDMLPAEKERSALAYRIYQACYHGHLPEWFWLKLADFCIAYAKEPR